MRDSCTRRVIFFSILVASCGLNHAVLGATNEGNLAARIAKLERSLDSRGLVDLLQQLEDLQQEVQLLRGQIEEQAYTITQLRKTQRDTYVDIDQRLQGVEQPRVSSGMTPGMELVPPLTTLDAAGADAVAGIPAPQSSLRIEVQPDANAAMESADEATEQVTSGSAPSAAAPMITDATPALITQPTATIDNEASEVAYRDAFSLLKAGQYDESIAAFSEFLQLYPSSQYADNAQYWLGETHYVMREYEPAVAEYRKLIENYPASMKRSHAMLKIGYSYHELGKIDQARAVLEDLRNRYAGTTAARLADERIQRILVESSPQ